MTQGPLSFADEDCTMRLKAQRKLMCKSSFICFGRNLADAVEIWKTQSPSNVGCDHRKSPMSITSEPLFD